MMACFYMCFSLLNFKTVKAVQRNWRFSLAVFGTSPTPQEECDSHHVHHAETIRKRDIALWCAFSIAFTHLIIVINFKVSYHTM